MFKSVAELRAWLKDKLTDDGEYISQEEFRLFGSAVLAYLERLERQVLAGAAQQREVVKAVAHIAQQLGIAAGTADAAEAGGEEEEQVQKPKYDQPFPAGFSPGGTGAQPAPPTVTSAPQSSSAEAAAPAEVEPLPEPDVVSTRAVKVEPIPQKTRAKNGNGGGEVKA